MDELIPTPAQESDYTPPDYIIRTTTDPEGIHACIRHMLPHKRYRLNLVFGLLLLVTGPTMLFLGETPLGIVSFVIAIYSLFFYVTFPTRVAKNQVAKLVEAYGTDTVPIEIIFWPQGVVFNNNISGGSAKFRYDIIRSIARFGDFLTFRTTEKQSIILRLTDVEEEASFLAYLKDHCPNANCIGI